jgi:hypothetical protein
MRIATIGICGQRYPKEPGPRPDSIGRGDDSGMGRNQGVPGPIAPAGPGQDLWGQGICPAGSSRPGPSSGRRQPGLAFRRDMATVRTRRHGVRSAGLWARGIGTRRSTTGRRHAAMDVATGFERPQQAAPGGCNTAGAYPERKSAVVIDTRRHSFRSCPACVLSLGGGALPREVQPRRPTNRDYRYVITYKLEVNGFLHGSGDLLRFLLPPRPEPEQRRMLRLR